MSMPQIPNITLVHAIICDDIRREDNGKFILIGVYPEVIILSAIPAQITLSLWLQFKIQIFNKENIEFVIRGSAIKEPINFSLDINDTNILGKPSSIPLIVRLPFAFNNPGDFTIFYRRRGTEEWQGAQTIQVKRNNASPILQ